MLQQSQQQMTTVIVANFERFTWRDERNGHCRFDAKTRHVLYVSKQYKRKEVRKNAFNGADETWYTLSCDAIDVSVPSLDKNTPLKIEGYFIPKSNEYSWDFKVVSCDICNGDDIMSMQYLENYVPYQDAMRIVKELGVDVFAFAKRRDASRMLQEKIGFSADEADDLIRTIRQTTAERDLFKILSPLGIPFPYCLKAVKKYGADAEQKLLRNPYYSGGALGMTFLECDKIARAAGVSPMAYERLSAIADETMRNITANGHTWCDVKTFRNYYQRTAKGAYGYEGQSANAAIGFPFRGGDVVSRKTPSGSYVIESSKLRDAEKRVAENIVRLASAGRMSPADRLRKQKSLASIVQYAEQECHMHCGAQQLAAFPVLLDGPGIKILSGEPGAGKTTTLRVLLVAFMRIHPSGVVKLCAPTGRAAQRMSESTGYPATTIHRLLEYRPYGERMAHKNANDPIKADLLVVDEASMVDIELFDILLDAIETGTTLLLVGDPEQLEAVGPGAVLYDLMHTDNNVVQKVHLTEVFRQKGDSPIRINAKKCKSGDTGLICAPDFEIIRTDNPENTLAVVNDISKHIYDPSNPFGTQILSPARMGVSGVDNMNASLQQLLNPKRQYMKEVVYGRNHYRVNDKVIMKRNNYDLDYCNGDCGIVTAVDSGAMTIDIRGAKHVISRMLMEDVKPAYAMTIHKSQGSDFPAVIAVMPKEPRTMLTRSLFYTAITRAKQKVYVVTEGDSMEVAINTVRQGVRKTGLQSLIREAAVKAGLSS